MSNNRSDAPPSPSDRRDTDPDPDSAPATPRDAGITLTLPSDAPPPKRSSRRPRASAEPGEDTLLSVPAPADARDVELDDRLRESERRLDDLDARVRYLENLGRAVPAPRSAREWVTWVVLMLVLAVSWLLFHR